MSMLLVSVIGVGFAIATWRVPAIGWLIAAVLAFAALVAIVMSVGMNRGFGFGIEVSIMALAYAALLAGIGLAGHKSRRRPA